MKNKEKLLIVSAFSPFPKTSGGAVRIYNEIKYLSNKYEIYFIFFLSNGQNLKETDINFLKKYTKKFFSFAQLPKRNFFSFIDRFLPYWFSNWENPELEIFLPTFIKNNKIKRVQIEFTQLLYLSDYVPTKIKKVFVALDVSTVSFWRRLKEINNPINILVHLTRWFEVYLYERYYFHKFDLIITMSKNDAELIRSKFKTNNVSVVPNGIEKINFLPKINQDKIFNFGYIGSFNHPPNRSAVLFFMNKIFPLLEKNNIDFRYFLAGDIDIHELNSIIIHSQIKDKKKIINLGLIDDVSEFYKKIDVLVAPILSGSGSRIKILESLSYGVPVITTKIGAEGIDVETDLLKIANSPKQYLYHINEIFNKTSDKIYTGDRNKFKKQLKQLLWETIFK